MPIKSIYGSTVVGADPTQDLHESRGRTLAYLVKADGWEDYSVEAARAGAAHSYVYGERPAARYDSAAEQEAREACRGLWGPPCNGKSVSSALKSGPVAWAD